MAQSTRRGFGKLRKLPSKRWQASYIGPRQPAVRRTRHLRVQAGRRGVAGRPPPGDHSGTWRPESAEQPKTRSLARAYAQAWLAIGRCSRAPGLTTGTCSHNRYPNLRRRCRCSSSTRPQCGGWHAALGDPHPDAAGARLQPAARDPEGRRARRAAAGEPGRHPRCRQREEDAHHPARNVAELETIVAEMPERYQAMVLFAAWCALRFGELVELRRDDIDLKAA